MSSITTEEHSAAIHPAKRLETKLHKRLEEALYYYNTCLSICRHDLRLNHDGSLLYTLQDEPNRVAEHAWSWMCDRVGVKLTAISGFLVSNQAVPSLIAFGTDAHTVMEATARARWARSFRRDLRTPQLVANGNAISLYDALEHHITQARAENTDHSKEDVSRLRMSAISATGNIQVSLGAVANVLGEIETYYEQRAQELRQPITSSE